MGIRGHGKGTRGSRCPNRSPEKPEIKNESRVRGEKKVT